MIMVTGVSMGGSASVLAQTQSSSCRLGKLRVYEIRLSALSTTAIQAPLASEAEVPSGRMIEPPNTHGLGMGVRPYSYSRSQSYALA